MYGGMHSASDCVKVRIAFTLFLYMFNTTWHQQQQTDLTAKSVMYLQRVPVSIRYELYRWLNIQGVNRLPGTWTSHLVDSSLNADQSLCRLTRCLLRWVMTDSLNLSVSFQQVTNMNWMAHKYTDAGKPTVVYVVRPVGHQSGCIKPTSTVAQVYTFVWIWGQAHCRAC